MDTLEDLNRKLAVAKDTRSVVKAMKAMAASRITQYELAAASLGDYFYTVKLGIKVYLTAERVQHTVNNPSFNVENTRDICAIVFGSDLGLVGQFNDLIADYVLQTLQPMRGQKEIWVIGERVHPILTEAGLSITKSYPVPGAIDSVTTLVKKLLIDIEPVDKNGDQKQFYLFHNQAQLGSKYVQTKLRLLPLDQQWMEQINQIEWPTNNIPEVIGNPSTTLKALINTYLFVAVFGASTSSLAAENASRLEAMQRAEKCIADTLEKLGNRFHSLRQSKIDEELFDVVSGFEALRKFS